MTDELREKVRIKCAEVEGYKEIAYGEVVIGALFGMLDGDKREILYYDNESDILRVVRLLDQNKYAVALCRVLMKTIDVPEHEHTTGYLFPFAVKATDDQMLEALSIVFGLDG